MRELTYFVATTLDGFIASPDGSFDFFPAEAGYLAALAVEWGDAFPTAFHQAYGTEPTNSRFDVVVMGRGTFEPSIQVGIANPYAHLDTYVYSTTLDPADHPHIQVVPTDPVTHVRQLKTGDGAGIWLCGGGQLAAALVEEIDHLVVKLNPATIAAGRSLFQGSFDPHRWRLESSQTFDLGVVLLQYRRPAEEQPTSPAVGGTAETLQATGTFDVQLQPGHP